MKTLHEYEATDIDISDEIHGFLWGQLIVTLMSWKKPAEGEDPQLAFNDLVAQFLNAAQKAGISITKAEMPAGIR